MPQRARDQTGGAVDGGGAGSHLVARYAGEGGAVEQEIGAAVGLEQQELDRPPPSAGGLGQAIHGGEGRAVLPGQAPYPALRRAGRAGMQRNIRRQGKRPVRRKRRAQGRDKGLVVGGHRQHFTIF